MGKGIKIVFSDLDGTLLRSGQNEFSERVFTMIKALGEKNIKFCVASGRTYQELREIFYKVKDDIYYIVSDGGAVFKGDSFLWGSPFKREHICRCINMMQNSNLLLYGKNRTYVRWVAGEFERQIINPYHSSYEKIEKLEDVKEDIYKASFYKEDSYGFERFKSYVKNNKIFDRVYQDKSWTEFVNKGIDKGVSAKWLMDYLNISFDEACAFGDNLNDLNLLKSVKESYAVKDGRPEIRAVARHICNNATEEIERMIFNG